MAGLPPSARLHRASEFAAFRNRSRAMSGRHFLVRAVASGGSEARLGLAVSRRVSKRAVTRNRIKRIVRESFRAWRAHLPPMDLLVIARPSASETPNPALRADLEDAWRKLDALKTVSTHGTIDG